MSSESSESKELSSVCEILKPVDHTKNDQPVDNPTDTTKESTPPEMPSLNLNPTNITHIIIPIDHTIEASLKDQPIIEPVKMTNVEIQINDKTYVKDENELDAQQENQENKENKEKPPLLSMTIKENQSMSIDEEKSYLDKKILTASSLEEDYNKWSTLGDHEYEPINPPDDSNKSGEIRSGPPIVKDEIEIANIDDDASSTTSADRKFLRIPLDDEVVVPEDGQDEDAVMTDEGISLEERYFNATPTTIGSKTDGEANTSSQIDSSALDTLPLRRECRKQAALAKQESTTSQNFGERMKSSANRIRTKLRAMRTRESKVTDRPLKESKRSKIKRPKSERPSILERARNFERPKFTAIKLPDRPKISLPKMPERSKISLPKMPDRPKLKMPDISMPKMRDISMPKMPDINFPSFSRKSTKEEVRVQESTNTVTTSGSEFVDSNKPTKRKRFDFDFRTYPKVLSRQKKTKAVIETTVTTSTTQSSDQEPKSTFLSIPDWVTMPRTKRKKGPVGQRWAHKFKDIKYVDESPQRSKENITYVGQSRTETDEPLVQHIPLRIPVQNSEEEKEEINKEHIERSNILYDDTIKDDIHQISAMEEDIADELKETIKSKNEQAFYDENDVNVKSLLQSGEATSGESLQPESNQSNVEDRSYQSSERGGVIEEIDSDEFFLREKGLSQDNIDVSLYLSAEIREAFQNPVNVLSQMANNNVIITDYNEYDKNIEDDYTKMRDSPELERPETPPMKTMRKKRKSNVTSQESNSLRDLINEDSRDYEKSKDIEEEEQKIETDEIKEMDEVNPPARPSRSRKASEIPEKDLEEITNYRTYPPSRPSRSRKSSMAPKESDSISTSQNDAIIDQNRNVRPSVPFRRRKSLRSYASLNIPDSSKESYMKKGPNISLQDIRFGYEGQGTPQVPKRRSRSTQSRSTVHSINDDDRSMEISTMEDKEQIAVIENDIIPGYAKIEKTKYGLTSAQPPARPKRKRVRETQFFTVPRRLKDEENVTPKRPSRNYSTLKHSSIERQINRASQENKENIIQDTEYIEIDDEDISNRKLKSGEVIQKMKSRPLPAPPRPPRKTHRSHIAHEGILKEIQPQDIITVASLRSEDVPSLKSEEIIEPVKDNVIKGTLLLGNQRENQENIIIELQPATIDQEQVFVEEKHNIIKPESGGITILHDMRPTSLEDIEMAKGEKSKNIKEMDDGTEKIDLPEKIIQQIIKKDDKSTLSTDAPDKSSVPEKLIEKEIIEVETSTQTDPLPDDFVCEEVIEEPTDIILIATNRKTITEQIPCEIQTPTTVETLENLARHIPLTQSSQLQERSNEKILETSPEQHDDSHLKTSVEKSVISEQSSSLSSQQVPDKEKQKEKEEEKEKEIPPPPSTVQIQPIEQSNLVMPETLCVQRLQVSDLDVGRLTVSELMAQKILSSEIDSMNLRLNEIFSQSGTITTDEIKLPPNVIESIISSLQISSQTEPKTDSSSTPTPQPTVIEKHITYYKEESTNTDDTLTLSDEIRQPVQTGESTAPSTTSQQKPQEILTPERILSQGVPYPHIYVLPPSFYPERAATVRDSSTNTVLTPDPEVPSVIDEIPDPSIPNLSAQLLKACHSSISRTIRRVLVELSSHLNTGDEKQDAQTAIIVLLVLLAALVLLGLTTRGDTVHHHHWEYFNPPSGDRPA